VGAIAGLSEAETSFLAEIDLRNDGGLIGSGSMSSASRVPD
jgi:hypothetical protein